MLEFQEPQLMTHGAPRCKHCVRLINSFKEWNSKLAEIFLNEILILFSGFLWRQSWNRISWKSSIHSWSLEGIVHVHRKPEDLHRRHFRKAHNETEIPAQDASRCCFLLFGFLELHKNTIVVCILEYFCVSALFNRKHEYLKILLICHEDRAMLEDWEEEIRWSKMVSWRCSSSQLQRVR